METNKIYNLQETGVADHKDKEGWNGETQDGEASTL